MISYRRSSGIRPRQLLAAAVFLIGAQTAGAVGLDFSSEYSIRALTYENLRLDTTVPNNRSFISQSARLGFAMKGIFLTDTRGETESMDIVLKLRALGIPGNTAVLSSPFDRIAANYPSTNFTPLFENAYIAAHNIGGIPWDLHIGQQSFILGSGLLLGDNGAGLAGIRAMGRLPWWGMTAEAFAFSKNSQNKVLVSGVEGGQISFFGGSLKIPAAEGTWQVSTLIEEDLRNRTLPVTGCTGGCQVSRARRWFSSLYYHMRYGRIVFEAEAAIQKGAATPTGAAAANSHITFNGNAQVVRAKWKQTFYKDIRGITRLVVARGSGDKPGTGTTDEAFFPSHGERFDGLERKGFGEFFGATVYDAFGGFSSATASGLSPGASGILIVGGGITPPAWKGFVMDIDYYLYQTEQNLSPDRTLGGELDIRIRYDFRDRLQLRASAAFVSIGLASNQAKGTAKRYMLEARAKF